MDLMLYLFMFLLIGYVFARIQRLFSVKIKGQLGENRVNDIYESCLGKEYYLFKNVTLPNKKYNTTAQLDHVIVSPYGIFVIETKTYSGNIYVKIDAKYWIQRFNRTSHKLYNPLKQNRTHIYVLNSYIKTPLKHIQNIVVFAGSANLKKWFLPKNITYPLRSVSYIKSFKTRIYNDKQIASIINSIKTNRLTPDKATDKLHVKNIKRKKGFNLGAIWASNV
jgi:restriction system protein